MWDDQTIMMLLEGTRDTLYMTLVSTFFGYVLGLPLGILLAVTDKEGIRPNAPLYKILDVIVNILRSIPFLILLILVIPLTKLIVGQSYGSSATIVPLVIAAAPFIARMVESSLKEVEPGVIEAAVSMGAGTGTIIWKVLLAEARTSLLVGVTIAVGTILGYSAMSKLWQVPEIMQLLRSEQEPLVTDSAIFLLERQEPFLSPARTSALMRITHCILSAMQMEAIT